VAPTRLAVLRIISGGQTGADQGGLIAARELGIPSGGTAPKDWLTESGSNEQLLRSFGLVECAEPGYDARTRKNVVDSDGTLLGKVLVPEVVANVEFGGAKRNHLFICGTTSLYTVKVMTNGAKRI